MANGTRVRGKRRNRKHETKRQKEKKMKRRDGIKKWNMRVLIKKET